MKRHLFLVGSGRTYRTSTGVILRVIVVRPEPSRKPPKRAGEHVGEWPLGAA